MSVIDQILGNERGSTPDAKNPKSSATGDGQFIDSTWLATISEARPDLITGLSRAQILDLRKDPALSREMTDFYANKNNSRLEAAGLPVRPGTTYLAHFAGPDGAMKVLGADPNAPVGGILGEKVVAANPFLRDMTAGGLIGWADKKMGGALAPQPAAPTQPAPQQPMGAPMIGAAPAPNFNNMAPPAQPQQQAAPQQQVDPFAQSEKDHFDAMKSAPPLTIPERLRQKPSRRMAQR